MVLHLSGLLNANSIYIAIPTSLTLGYQANHSASIPLLPFSLCQSKTIYKAGFPLAVLRSRFP